MSCRSQRPTLLSGVVSYASGAFMLELLQGARADHHQQFTPGYLLPAAALRAHGVCRSESISLLYGNAAVWLTLSTTLSR